MAFKRNLALIEQQGGGDGEREIYLGANIFHTLFFKVNIGGVLPVTGKGCGDVESKSLIA